MKNARSLKKGATCMALAALITAMGITPITNVTAATNNQASTDIRKDGAQEITATIPYGKKEITLNVTGKYQLKPVVSKFAEKKGFWIEGNALKVEKTDNQGKTYVVSYPLTWKASNSRVAVSGTGKVEGLKVSKVSEEGKYIATKVTASIDPNTTFVDDDNITYYFKDGVVFTQLVTVAPTEDLNVYFQGVWKEDSADNDAMHITDYAVRESNVDAQLKVMAEAVTGHCVGESYDILAYTKTNDDCVRAYIVTHNKSAGKHYYVAKFKTNEAGVNKITFTQRDYCDNVYTVSGVYKRAK